MVELPMTVALDEYIPLDVLAAALARFIDIRAVVADPLDVVQHRPGLELAAEPPEVHEHLLVAVHEHHHDDLAFGTFVGLDRAGRARRSRQRRGRREPEQHEQDRDPHHLLALHDLTSFSSSRIWQAAAARVASPDSFSSRKSVLNSGFLRQRLMIGTTFFLPASVSYPSDSGRSSTSYACISLHAGNDTEVSAPIRSIEVSGALSRREICKHARPSARSLVRVTIVAAARTQRGWISSGDRTRCS